MTDQQQYLSPDGVGESPLPDYPGRITFPHVMTLPMHKRWQAFVNNRASERDANDMRIGVSFIGTANEGQRLLFNYDDVELARMFGKLEVTGPDGKKLTEKTPEDAMPLAVAVWIAKCYREWENSQLLFRWNGSADMATPDSAA